MQRLIQLVFWLAMAATLYFCLRNVGVVVRMSDKTQHGITFGMLMLLAAGAYPYARTWLQALALSGLGAMIEFIQPYFGRDKDVRDWVADTAGILIVIVVVLIARNLLRRERNSAV